MLSKKDAATVVPRLVAVDGSLMVFRNMRYAVASRTAAQVIPTFVEYESSDATTSIGIARPPFWPVAIKPCQRFWKSTDVEIVKFLGFDNTFFYSLFFSAIFQAWDPEIRLPDALLANEFYRGNLPDSVCGFVGTSRNRRVIPEEKLTEIAALLKRKAK